MIFGAAKSDRLSDGLQKSSRPASPADGDAPGRLGARNGGGGRARILVLSAPALVRSIPDVVHQLLDAGAEVIFSGWRVEKLRVPDEILAHPCASVVELPLRRMGDAGESVAVLRAMADLTSFLSGDLDHGSWARTRAARRLLKLVKNPQYDSMSRMVADVRLPSEVHTRLTTAFREVERLLPTPPGLDEAIERLGVDAVVLLTRCSFGGPEPDVIKAARRLGLPSIMLVWSWDNLSSKAILNEHPDHLIVWNDVQAAEAVRIHGVPQQRVLIAGAPSFDRFFQEVQKHARSQLHRPANQRATILYLGSSSDVAREEPAIFAKWITALRSNDNPVVRDANVIVRPHPADRAWLSWSPPDAHVLLAPAGGKIEPEALSQLLAKIDVVVALNTTAEIEAAIADRPVLTFRAGREAPGQEGRLHFSYLLEQHGGFVIDAETVEEHLRKLGAVLRGNYDPSPVRRFVERFVRPGGLTQPVSPIVASAILELARQPADVTR